MNLRKNPVGEITAKDGTKFTVPTANNFETAPKLPDLYNECAGVTPKDMSEVDLNKVPVVEVDKDGEVVTGFMVADNYFELYINGKLIGVDATPFTPFNSHVVRFRVKRPYTIAVLGQDWEDKLGLRHGGLPGEHLAFWRRRFVASSPMARRPIAHGRRSHSTSHRFNIPTTSSSTATSTTPPTSAGGSTRWRSCRPAGSSASRSIIQCRTDG